MTHCSLKFKMPNKQKIKKELLTQNSKFNWLYGLLIKLNFGGCIPLVFERRRMLQVGK